MNTDVIDPVAAAAVTDARTDDQPAPAPEDLTPEDPTAEDLTAEDLIEEVSIDGMCGVY